MLDPIQEPTTPASMTVPTPDNTLLQGEDKDKKERNELWRSRITACVNVRDRKKREWKTNTDYRVNKPFEVVPEVDTITVPVDWSRTKNKQAQLFFQVPDINLKARNPQFTGAAPVGAAALNFELQEKIRAEKVMDECLSDVINAAGFAVAMVGYDVTTEKVQVPAIDTKMIPPAQLQVMQSMGQIPMTEAEQKVYDCYYMERVSPAQFLWPTDFTGSDWQRAPWLGRDGLMPLAEAKRRGWVKDDYERDCSDKIQVVSSQEDEKDRKPIGKYVHYQQIWYRKSELDLTEKDPRKLGYLVFVDGKTEPVVDEDFRWQRYDETSRNWIGMTTFPLYVLTLTTLSDDALPPSDSEIGRPQVRELIRFRSQMMRQRDRSTPLRWFDVNMVDEEIIESIRKGVYQDIIPVNGPGDRAIGEVARANYPRENNEFMSVIQFDLDQAWSSGPNQQGFENQGSTSATEANIMNTAAGTRLEYEQSRVLSFFLDCAKGVFNLMQLFADDTKWVEVVGPDKLAQFKQWDRNIIRGDYAFHARPDAALRVDVSEWKQESLNLYKLLRQDPLVNPQIIVAEVLESHGIDPTTSLVPPSGPQANPATLRYTFSANDFINPLVVALAQKNSTTPITPEDLANAKKLMEAAGIPVVPDPVAPPPQPGAPTAPGAEMGTPNAEHGGPPPQVNPLNQRYEGPEQQQ
jgi:hypothetical protein